MKTWFTSTDLNKFSLPGLPTTKRSISRMAARQNWNTRARLDGEPLARKRSGRGGGMEYHYSVLPPVTVSALSKRGLIPVVSTAGKKNANLKSEWQAFEKLSRHKKKIANFRLKVLGEVEALQRLNQTKTAAIAMVCINHSGLYQSGKGEHHNFSRATVYNWFKLVEGRAKKDRLPALAPKQIGRVAKQDIDPQVIQFLRGDYLRPEQPPFMACFERLQQVAADKGWELPHHRTLQRNFLKNVPEPVITLLRKGPDALEMMYPPQTRDRSEFHAMEAVNADGHKFDVFVTKDGSKPFRPHLVAFQDLYSGKILSWRWAESFTAELVRLTCGDLFKNFGIPDLCWFDNGRDFAAKMITGGTKNRYRFKIVEEEPVGFLTALGVDVRWARPGRGQSKPIERAFRDFCGHIAKHPKFAGAYTGNAPHNKPSNYGETAIDARVFDAVLNAGIAAHNARAGRRSRVCAGKLSFNQAFEASYTNSVIKKAGPEQLRMCLLAGEVKKTDRRSGVVTIKGNTYWSEELAGMPSEKVIVRFDPDNLHTEIHVYRLDGSYVGAAPVFEAKGFADADAARVHSNAKKKFMKAQKELAKQEVAMSVADVAALLPDDIPEPVKTNPKVVRGVFPQHGNAAAKVEFDWDTFEDNIEHLPTPEDI